ncbi:MAG: hypothetical protein ACR2PF_15350 [Rhizobiaceae bacterium]
MTSLSNFLSLLLLIDRKEDRTKKTFKRVDQMQLIPVRMDKQKTSKVLCVIALLGMTATVHSQETGNQAAGRKLAQDVCVECHAIKSGTEFSLNLLAPTFQDIADTPSMNGLALSVWSVVTRTIRCPKLCSAMRSVQVSPPTSSV